jgi:putative FmdB family regulatory protein
MPTYEYKCDACGNTFEKYQSITSKPIRKCPKCGKNKVKRLIGTGGGLIFKGSGFYITDYRSDQYKNAAKSDSGVTTDKPAEKTDSKPAAEKSPTKAESTGPAATPAPAPPKKESKRSESKGK